MIQIEFFLAFLEVIASRERFPQAVREQLAVRINQLQQIRSQRKLAAAACIRARARGDLGNLQADFSTSRLQVLRGDGSSGNIEFQPFIAASKAHRFADQQIN